LTLVIAILKIYTLHFSRIISNVLEKTPERQGNSTVAVTTSDETHPTFVPRSTLYYWPDTPTKPQRDQSYGHRPLMRQHTRLFLRQPGPGLEGIASHLQALVSLTWLILVCLIVAESGPTTLVPQFSAIQDLDGMWNTHSLST
jgi:hypothetical protein